MELHRLLEKKKTFILDKWLTVIFDIYTDDTATFLKDEKDMFANPVGQTITANAGYILEGLIKGEDTDALSVYIERIIRIRAVQPFTAARAVSFINGLKTVIIDQLKPSISRHNLWDEWEELQSTIDKLTHLAFKIFTKMKERIESIRTREIEKNERFLIKLMGSRAR